MQNYLLVHRIAFLKNTTNYISVIYNFKNVSRKNTFWERYKNASVLLSGTYVYGRLKNQRFIRIPERPARLRGGIDNQ